MKNRLLVFTLFWASTQVMAQGDANDMEALKLIRTEGLEHSKVMDHAFYLTDVNGPRLTNSTGYLNAAKWAVAQLKSWGFDAKLEPWGDWGKGWTLEKSYLAMTTPYYKPLIAFPKAWCSGTDGEKKTELVLLKATDSVSLEAYRGKLAGKIVLVPKTDTLIPGYKPDAGRQTDEQLKKMTEWKPSTQSGGFNRGGFRGQQGGFNINKIKEFAQKEGAIAMLSAGVRGRDGTLFVSGGGAYTAQAPANFLDMVVSTEDYLTLYRLAAAEISVKMEADVRTSFTASDTRGYNVVGELKGSDKKLRDEYVMVGGHLDSWHAATGATDNAAGCSVMMEALRIIKTTGLKPKRSIRICLWGGEEQGLHGSRNYVRNHFTDTTTRKMNAEGDKVSAYYNLDNGTGKIRGVYLQGNEQVKPVFATWLEPFADLGASTLTLQNTGGTDHLSFDGIGIPGFQFIQDEIEYDTRTHHTNMDTYDHLIPMDLRQAATIIAYFVYNTAQRTEKLPRKPAPDPSQQRGRF